MVGERDREQQDAVRWEHTEDDAAISIPPPFNSSYNGTIQQQQQSQNHRMHQQFSSMAADGSAGGDDLPTDWDDEQQIGFMGDSMVDGMPVITEKGVRFPVSPTHAVGEFSNSQFSQAPLQSLHSRY